MSFRPFTSESYAQDDRPEAWRDVLAAVGLQPAAGTIPIDGHATASHRNAAGVALTRMAAGVAERVAAAAIRRRPADRVAADRGRRGAARAAAAIGSFPSAISLLLPRSGDWSVVFQRDMRAIVLSVTSEALHGRTLGKPRLGEPHGSCRPAALPTCSRACWTRPRGRWKR